MLRHNFNFYETILQKTNNPIFKIIENLKKNNISKISIIFYDSMNILLDDTVLLYVMDAAFYVTKSGHAIKIFYIKLINMGWMDHGHHIKSKASKINFTLLVY